MKKLLPLLLMLLTGCGARDSSEEGQTVPLQDDLLANLTSASTSTDPAQLQALVDRAMAAALPDVGKAHYRNVRSGVGGAACGEVAIAGSKGPYRNFVVSPDAVAVIGAEPGINFNDPSDFLADAWIRWCASPEELQLVEHQLDSGPAPSTDMPTIADDPPMIEDPLPTLPQRGPIQRSAAVNAPPPPPAQIDSFSNSVSRPQ